MGQCATEHSTTTPTGEPGQQGCGVYAESNRMFGKLAKKKKRLKEVIVLYVNSNMNLDLN